MSARWASTEMSLESPTKTRHSGRAIGIRRPRRGEKSSPETSRRHKHLPLTVIRPSGIYGPGDTRFLPLFRSVATGRFVMIGRGDVHYHPTYIDDLVDGLIRCADAAPAENRTYILAGAAPVTLNEFVETIAAGRRCLDSQASVASHTTPPRRARLRKSLSAARHQVAAAPAPHRLLRDESCLRYLTRCP